MTTDAELETILRNHLAAEAERHRTEPDLGAVLDGLPTVREPRAAAPARRGRMRGQGPNRRTRWRVVGGAVAAAVLLVVALRADPLDESSVAIDDTHRPPTADDPVDRADHACGEQHTENMMGEPLVDFGSLMYQVIVFEALDRPDRFVVVAVGDEGWTSCVVRIGADGGVDGFTSSYGLGRQPQPAELDAVAVVTAGAVSDAPLEAGDGSARVDEETSHVYVLGRVGALVESISVTMPDGTELPAEIIDRWYVAQGTFPISPEQAEVQVTERAEVSWTLVDDTGQTAAIATLTSGED